MNLMNILSSDNTINNNDNINGNKTKGTCKWSEPPIKNLLSFLAERKSELESLKTQRGGSKNSKSNLWLEASSTLSNYGYTYSSQQCQDKWKNLLKEYKVLLLFML
jgi:hypothetical protein